MSETVRRVDPTSAEEWRRLVTTGSGSVFVSPPWLETLARTYGCDVLGFIVDGDDGTPRSGLAAAVLEDAAGRRVQSLPFSDYADPVIGSTEDVALLVEALLAAGSGVPTRARLLHTPTCGFAHAMTCTGEAAWHAIRLDGEASRWDALGGSARRNIRKAREHGVTVSFRNDEGAVDIFYKLHLGTRKYKYRLLPQPAMFLAHMREAFAREDGFWVALAELDDQPIAAIVLLEWGSMSYYKFNASSGSALEARPNDLLLWECMEFVRSRGKDVLDLGLSDLDQSGLVRYKQKFATDEARITTWLAGPPVEPSVADLKRRLGELTHLLTDPSVPDEVTSEAGRLLYRYFS